MDNSQSFHMPKGFISVNTYFDYNKLISILAWQTASLSIGVEKKYFSFHSLICKLYIKLRCILTLWFICTLNDSFPILMKSFWSYKQIKIISSFYSKAFTVLHIISILHMYNLRFKHSNMSAFTSMLSFKQCGSRCHSSSHFPKPSAPARHLDQRSTRSHWRTYWCFHNFADIR